MKIYSATSQQAIVRESARPVGRVQAVTAPVRLEVMEMIAKNFVDSAKTMRDVVMSLKT